MVYSWQRLKSVGKERDKDRHEFDGGQNGQRQDEGHRGGSYSRYISAQSSSPTRQLLDGSIKKIPRRDRVCRRRLPVPGWVVEINAEEGRRRCGERVRSYNSLLAYRRPFS